MIRRVESMTMTSGQVADDGSEERATVVISSPEELIASIPAMLGFPPGPGSVVVMCGQTADGGQGPVVRMDVDGLLNDVRTFADTFPGPEAASDNDVDPDDEYADGLTLGAIDPGPAQGLARFCAREGVTEVHLVVVHEECAQGYGAGLRAEDAAEAFEYWLGSVGTTVSAAYGVGEFAEGSPWVDLFGMVRGVQQDPDTTQIAAVHAYGGRVRAGSRDEIDQLYLARDVDAVDAVDVDLRGRERSTGYGAGEVLCVVEGMDDVARRLEVGEEVDDDELAVVGRDLLDIAVRDEVYRRLAVRGLGERDGRRLLWWAVARRRPARERSVALLLLGAAAYFEGRGVHAWSALSAAIDADGQNSLARLLIHGLHHGLAPDRLRRVAAAV